MVPTIPSCPFKLLMETSLSGNCCDDSVLKLFVDKDANVMMNRTTRQLYVILCMYIVVIVHSGLSGNGNAYSQVQFAHACFQVHVVWLPSE